MPFLYISIPEILDNRPGEIPSCELFLCDKHTHTISCVVAKCSPDHFNAPATSWDRGPATVVHLLKQVDTSRSIP